MEKLDVVASLGQMRLLRPAWIKAALAANDRIKLYLAVVQAADAHAAEPNSAPADLRREFAAAQVGASWLRDLPGTAYREDRILQLPGLMRLAGSIRDDLRIMARPLSEGPGAADGGTISRLEYWCGWLDALFDETLDPSQIRALTSGKRGGEDSLHLLVMDLHKALNRLAGELSDESVDGAHVWQLNDSDRAGVAAFMRGINRTRKLKLNPGLDTAATRDGERLLLQNDIGTSDAHVLVIQVEGMRISLTYSDLHRRRFGFFQSLLEELGASWSTPDTRITTGINAGDAYQVGTAVFECQDAAALHAALEGIGARIVFLITGIAHANDWNCLSARRMRRRFSWRASVARLATWRGWWPAESS